MTSIGTFSETYGPTPFGKSGEYDANADAKQQANLFAIIERKCTKSVYPILSGDYIRLDAFDGIEYYIPNSEEWGGIVAISEEHKLAHFTGFHEMDDMAADHGEYRQVVQNGRIMCNFEACIQ